ncbi:putative sugar phosphate/phosphate translocator [Nannochloris sp. 'desiccata']|nr:hypothetical protein KSW81_002384 [Chlorella desiccata (nom. nud.)]KAH7617123.1 putative sugar phosphate/phosphate translocator [Chlorella desiccata (nom. nud.)]
MPRSPTNDDEDKPFLPSSTTAMKSPTNLLDDESHKFSILGLSPAIIAIVSSIAWMSVSSGLILLNKSILSNGFPYPMTLSGLGMGFSSIASYITCHHLKLVEAKKVVSWNFYITRILPVGLFMALTLHFGNLVYLHLTVSFIQILKSFTPVITMLALFIAQLETPTKRLIWSVSVIAAGTAIASIGEVNFSALGVLIMMLSETFEATRLVMTQLLLTGLKFHPIEGLMYLAPACFFWLAFGSLVMEFRPMLTAGAFQVVAAQPWKFILAAGLGFAVNSIAYIIIQTASSLTLKVLGTVKNAFVVWLGIVLLGETMTFLQGIGYSISIAAFYWYQRIKMEQIKDGTGGNSSLPSTPMRGNSGTFDKDGSRKNSGIHFESKEQV